MEVHRESVEVAQQACRALEELAYSQHIRKHYVGSKAIGKLVSLMGRHGKNADVQECACAAMWTLTDKNTSGLIMKAGGIQKLLAAMKTHKKAAQVQEHACGALKELAKTDDDCRSRIADSEGISGVLEAMKEHSQKEEVQKEACGVLWQLSRNPALVDRMKAAGAVECVRKAMQADNAEPDAKKWGAQFLANIREKGLGPAGAVRAEGDDALDSDENGVEAGPSAAASTRRRRGCPSSGDSLESPARKSKRLEHKPLPEVSPYRDLSNSDDSD